MKLLHDLRRRRMFRLVGLYIVGAWVVIQVAEALFQAWGVPETANRFVFIAAALCFPIALVFGWIYDITPQGIVRTGDAMPGETVEMRLRRQDYLILGALLVVGIAILGKSATDIAEEIDESVETLARLEKSVAVLPFDSLDLNAETAVFSDGVSAEILHRLSTLRLLNVIAAPSSFALRNSEESVPAITRLLGVRYLLLGNVRRDRNTVRITANLLDETGRNVWSQTFDRELEDIFVVQAEIASTVSSEILNEIVAPSELPAGRTTDSKEAYSEYLVGKAYVTTRTPGWQPAASAAFQRALEFDDSFAPALAGLAITLYVRGYGGDFEEIRQLSLRAIEIAPDLAEGHAILGLLQAEIDQDAENSIRNLRRAIDLDPSFSHAYNWLAIAYLEAGMMAEARAIQDRGLEIDPLNPPLVANIASRTAREGNPDRARLLLDRLLHVPETPALALWELIDLETDFGQHDKALEWAREAVRSYDLEENATPLAAMALVHERLGMTDEAAFWMEQYNRLEQDGQGRLMRTTYWLRQRGGHAEGLAMMQSAGIPPESQWPHLPPMFAAVLTAAHVNAGDYETGLAIYDAATGGDPAVFTDNIDVDFAIDFLHITAFGLQQAGQESAAKLILDHVDAFIQEEGNSLPHFPPMLMRVFQQRALSGDPDGAFEAMERAISLGWTDLFWVLADPSLETTLARQEFRDLFANVRVEIDRQRSAVEEDNAVERFREEFEALNSR